MKIKSEKFPGFARSGVARKMQNSKKGFSIMEVVAAIGIFTVVFISIYGSFKAGLTSLMQSRRRTEATALANEKMEIIRNLPYDSVGTQGGSPAGSLLQTENVTRSNQKFTVKIAVDYVDDPFDGTAGGNPPDPVYPDYKTARVEVDWPGVQAGKGVTLVSKFVPDGVETNVGGGTMQLNLIDSTGAGVSGVDVHLVNNSTNPTINTTVQSDSTGSVLKVGMPAGDRTYEITASKDGYEAVSTYPPYPTTPDFEPTDVHGSAIEGQLTSKTIIIDKLGNFSFSSRDINDQPVPNVNFNLSGGRELGETAADPPQIVYGYNQNLETDGQGNISVDSASPGKYTLTLNEPGYTLIGTETPLMPFVLAPGASQNITLIVVPTSVNSLVAKILNANTNERINGASVHLSDGAGFDQTLTTGEAGQVYFPPNLDPPVALAAGQYNLEVTADGFQGYSGTVNINQLTTQEIKLAPQ